MSQCCEKPKRSIKGDLWVSGADPGTASVSALAGEGGGSGEGGLSSTMRGWLSASASSTCTSGCSFVAGTWREEGEDGQRERERDRRTGRPGLRGLVVFFKKATERMLGAAFGSLTSQQSSQECSRQGVQECKAQQALRAKPPQPPVQEPRNKL